ncbi:MAG: hypothetical protein KC649_02855 [Candidatus Omnitrophica bacterium]|nr:hypothetical protein [Candidatus Omnitrophota bacterium]
MIKKIDAENTGIIKSVQSLNEQQANTNQQLYKVQRYQINQIANVRSNLSTINQPLPVLNRLDETVFDDLLYGEKLMLEQKNAAIAQINKEILKGLKPFLTSKPVQIVTDLMNIKGQMHWVLSEEGQKLLESGAAKMLTHKETGKLLPTIVDSDTGKFVEQFKGINPSKINWASMTNLVFNAAHMIAGYDNAQQIKKLSKNIEQLLEGRKIDKQARLEACYIIVKELMSKENITREEKHYLLHIHKELVELRSNWKNEIISHLGHINDPAKDGWFEKTFTFNKTKDNNIKSGVSKFEEQLIQFKFAIDFDILICMNIEHPISLIDDLAGITKIRKLLEEKRTFLTGKHPDYDFVGTIELVKSIENRLQKFNTLKYSNAPQTIHEAIENTSAKEIPEAREPLNFSNDRSSNEAVHATVNNRVKG